MTLVPDTFHRPGGIQSDLFPLKYVYMFYDLGLKQKVGRNRI